MAETATQENPFGQYNRSELEAWLQNAIQRKMQNKAICIVGPMGSGKTVMTNAIARALELGGCTVMHHASLLPRDILRAATEADVVLLDNMLWRYDNPMDAIATILSQTHITQRKLYTDQDHSVQTALKANLIINSLSYPTRADIHQRMLYIVLSRYL